MEEKQYLNRDAVNNLLWKQKINYGLESRRFSIKRAIKKRSSI